MKFRIQFVNELMTVADNHGYGHDAFEVDPDAAWDAVEQLAQWGRKYALCPCPALEELRAYLCECE